MEGNMNQNQNAQQQTQQGNPQGQNPQAQQGQNPKKDFFLVRGFKAVKEAVGKGVNAVKETVHDHPVVSGIFMGLGIGAGSYVTYKVMAPMCQAAVPQPEEPKQLEGETDDEIESDDYEEQPEPVEYVDTDR